MNNTNFGKEVKRAFPRSSKGRIGYGWRLLSVYKTLAVMKGLAQVRRLGGVFDFFQKNTLDTNLSGAIWGILFA
jgi:hypothetical protein